MITVDLNNLGRFHAAKIDRQRVRVFVSNDGRVGCSRRYSRIEAYRNSQNPVVIQPGETALVALLRSRGFPVSENSTIDDQTALEIINEINGLRAK